MANIKKSDSKATKKKAVKKNDTKATKKETIKKIDTTKKEVTKKDKVNSKTKESIEVKKIHNYKLPILVGCLIALLFFGVSISFSLFNYTRVGNANELLVGNIYLHYNMERTISILEAIPRSDRDLSNYVEFTIDGLNENKEKDIWYAIDLIHGDIPNEMLEENRIRDNLLRFTLTKQIDDGQEEIVLENKGYSDLNGERIYVEKIMHDTNTVVNHKYKLYMWISDSIIVGNTPEADYTTAEWNNLFASIKVRVIGDFEEKGTKGDLKVIFNPNGGTVSENVKYYNHGDLYGELPVPKRDGYSFVGWRYNGNNIKSTDVVQDLGASYIMDDDIEFTGFNNVYTPVKPFSEENFQKNFYVSFEIKEDNSTVFQSTLVNAKLENEGKGYPGFVFRKTTSYYEISANVDDKVYKRISNLPLTTQKVEILRLNKKLYYRLDENKFIELLDFSSFTNYFDEPLVIGSSINSNGNPQRYFIGTLSNIVVEYLEDDITFDNFKDRVSYSTEEGIILKAVWAKGKYEHPSEVVFDGTNYIDTEVCLFSEENINRNFFMSFEIVEDNTVDTSGTVMSSKNENGDPWPGFDFRHNGNLNYYYSKATSKSPSSSGTVIDKIKNSTRKVSFLRINNILYYSFDSDTFTFFHDFTGYKLYNDIPVTFGASYYNKNVRRYFIGKLKNIVLEFISDDATVSEYEELL